FPEDVPAVPSGHHHVEQDHVRFLAPRGLDPGRAVLGLVHDHPGGLEIDAAEEPDRPLVVDHQHPRRHAGSYTPPSPCPLASASGSSNAKLDPPPSAESTQMRPPMARTRPRAM